MAQQTDHIGDANKMVEHHIVDANKMITAIDWLVNQIFAKHGLFIYDKVIQEAKAMEKKQMIDAHIEGQRVFDNYKHTQWTTDQAEQYYNETYNK
jgi:hypothetical protein